MRANISTKSTPINIDRNSGSSKNVTDMKKPSNNNSNNSANNNNTNNKRNSNKNNSDNQTKYDENQLNINSNQNNMPLSMANDDNKSTDKEGKKGDRDTGSGDDIDGNGNGDVDGNGSGRRGRAGTASNAKHPTDGGNSSHDDDGGVKCIFLCEFHVTAGRKIAVQVPANYLSKEKFETVSRYVIPQVQLQRSFLSVSLLGIKILSYPVRIDHKQYARNAFYFNICFVFSPATRTIGYEPVVRKLSEYLLAMEHSSKILSQQQDAAQMMRIARLLTQVRNDINSKKMCMLQEGSTLIPLCVVPRYHETTRIYHYQAAALTDEFYKYVRAQWDLTTLRILPYINGFNHVNRITALADVALELVCDCIKHLVILGVAVVVPVFQYSNVYRPTPKLSQLAKCRDLQRKCVQKCSKSGRQSASVRDVFRIFASMAHGATFGELCVRFNPAALNINEKQMVLFGQLEGLIRRVDKYPVTVSRNLFASNEDDITKPKLGSSGLLPNTAAFEAVNNSMNQQKKQPSKPLPRGGRALKSSDYSGTGTQKILYTGHKSFDEICCNTGMSTQQLEAHLARNKHVIVLLK